LDWPLWRIALDVQPLDARTGWSFQIRKRKLDVPVKRVEKPFALYARSYITTKVRRILFSSRMAHNFLL
jgi:hypothetical protein